MTLKEQALREILKIEGDAIYDTSLKSLKKLDSSQRRKIIFELVEEGKIELIEKNNIHDVRFPLLVAPMK